MKEEFNLSSNIRKLETSTPNVNIRDNLGNFILVKDVKEFIKRLKREFSQFCGFEKHIILTCENRIDKLAGEELK